MSISTRLKWFMIKTTVSVRSSDDLGPTPLGNDLAYSSSFSTSVVTPSTTAGTRSGSPRWAIRTSSSMAATPKGVRRERGRWVQHGGGGGVGAVVQAAGARACRRTWRRWRRFGRSRLGAARSPSGGAARQRSSRRSRRWPGRHSWGRSRSPGLPCSTRSRRAACRSPREEVELRECSLVFVKLRSWDVVSYTI
jgi:hypothetical protein